MCRFLIVKAKQEIQPEQLLTEFAGLCKNSIAPGGDRQEDGWGVAWVDEKGQWQSSKSLKPIWEDEERFGSIAKTKLFVAHARSATFPKEKGVLAFNQPFIYGKYCFVFNGAIRGVSLGRPVEGKIGSQKIWSLLKEYLQENQPALALERLKKYLEKHSKEIIALNVGVITKDSLVTLCKYTKDQNYYTIYYQKENPVTVCSIDMNALQAMKNNQILVIPSDPPAGGESRNLFTPSCLGEKIPPLRFASVGMTTS